MEFWELLFFTDFVLVILLLLWKIKSVWFTVDENTRFTPEEKKEKHVNNWLFFILSLIVYGVGLFTFMVKAATELLLLPLTQLMTFLTIINGLLFLAEMFYILKWKSEEVINAQNAATLDQFHKIKM